MTDDGLETLKFLQQAFTFTHRKWSALPLPPLPDREDLQAIPFSSSTDLPPLFDVNLLDNEVADPLPEPSIFICPFCTSTFMNLQALGVHEGKIHGTLLDKHCYVCGQEEQTEYHLSTHIALCELMFTEHKPQTWVGLITNVCVCNWLILILSHVLCFRQQIICCILCPNDFPSMTSLRIHMSTDHDYLPCTYDNCFSYLNSQAALDKHVWSITSENQYSSA